LAQLEVKDISYSYKNLLVLNGISIAISPGEIVGLLGVNGAGKSTLFKLISGLYFLQKGSIFFKSSLCARPGFCVSQLMRAQMGVVFQECSLDAKLSAKANLRLSGLLYGLTTSQISLKSESELAEFGLNEVANDPVKTFSGGMKRKLELLRAMLHDPSFLLMDEPSAGLDQDGFHRFWEKIFLNRQVNGLTVLVATHRSEEAEKCDRLLVLHNGKLITSKSPAELKSCVQGDRVCLSFLKTAKYAQKLIWLNILRDHFTDLNIEFVNEEVSVVANHGAELVPRLVEILPPFTVESVYVRRPTIADAFLEVTGVRL
jgi:ABC-2 type transport system ATP-binding protein